MTESVVKQKFCLVGDGGVGKTSLIRRFVLDQFDDRYITTIGTKVTKKSVDLKDSNGSRRVDMMLWDIMGQQGYRTGLQDSYFKGAVGILSVCDCTRKETLASLQSWIESVRKACGEVPVIILANKADLRENMQISPEDLKEQKEKVGALGFCYTSAKTGANVEKSFLDMARTTLV